MEKGKPSPEEIRKYWRGGEVRTWGVVRNNTMSYMAAQKRGTQGGQKGLELLLDIQNQLLQRSKQFGPKLR